jgi:TIR domain-containing protein
VGFEPHDFCFRLVPRLACFCHRLLDPKGNDSDGASGKITPIEFWRRTGQYHCRSTRRVRRVTFASVCALQRRVRWSGDYLAGWMRRLRKAPGMLPTHKPTPPSRCPADRPPSRAAGCRRSRRSTSCFVSQCERKTTRASGKCHARGIVFPDSHVGPFVSYRRVDSSGSAGRLFDRLTDHFGRNAAFMDGEAGIARGDDFASAIDQALKSVDALLVVIGPRWPTRTNADGTRHLDNPDDWVRLEIETGLRRGIQVLPILVAGPHLYFHSGRTDAVSSHAKHHRAGPHRL